MSIALQPQLQHGGLARTRLIAAAIGVVVVFDVAWVRAPFLLMLAVPFLVAAWRYRGEHPASKVALLAVCVLYVAAGVAYAINNGLRGPTEPGEASKFINPGDFAMVYIGTPLAAWLVVRLIASMRRSRLERTSAVA